MVTTEKYEDYREESKQHIENTKQQSFERTIAGLKRVLVKTGIDPNPINNPPENSKDNK